MKTFKYVFAHYLPIARSSATLFGLLCAMGLLNFTTKQAVAQNSVQRDSQALTILAQTIAAGGGQEALTLIRDFTGQGKVTYNKAEPVTGTVTLKSRGLHQLKIEIDLASGKRTTVVNGEGGSLTGADGRSWPIHRESIGDIGSLMLPYLPLIAAIQDSSTSIFYGGLVTHDGATLLNIRIRRAFSRQQDPNGDRGIKEARDFFIDPKTLLVSAVSDRIQYGWRPDDKGVPREILYSNYQSENGVAFPLTIAEAVRGVTGLTYSFSQVTINSGLADSDFVW